MIFIAVHWSDTTHSNYKLLRLPNCLMVLWNKKVSGSFGFLKKLVLQWKSPTLLNVDRMKIKSNSKHFKNQIMQKGKSLFTERFIHYKTSTLREGTKSSFLKCSPATQSSNFMIEIVSYLNRHRRICILCVYYVYICLYRYVLFALVSACSYLHIFTYSFGSYRGLIRLHFVFWSPLSLHCYEY